MISYERIEKSEGNDFNKGKDSIKCVICNYFYFKDIGFKYQPYVQVLSDFFIATGKNIDYRVYIANVDKGTALNILNNSNSSDKGVL